MRGLPYIKDAVAKLLGDRFAGHDTLHVFRVYDLAMHFCDTCGEAYRDLVAAAALLHDCDDYKLFGEQSARLLTNTRRILNEAGLDDDFGAKCIRIVQTIGYGKRLAGVAPWGIEGEIVSDADMCDAIGAVGIVRCIEFGAQDKRPFFDPRCLPEKINYEKYKQNAHRSTTLNHFFDKLLRLRELCLTEPGRRCAAQRHQIMVNFLQAYFDEVKAPKAWRELLAQYV